MNDPRTAGPSATPAQPAAYTLLGREVGMLADRFRSLSDARLARPLAPYASRAEAGWRLAQLLADAALGVRERATPGQPAWRQVPEVGPFAVGDQIGVTGSDLLAALDGVPETDPVWTREGRRTAGEVAAGARDALRNLRLTV